MEPGFQGVWACCHYVPIMAPCWVAQPNGDWDGMASPSCVPSRSAALANLRSSRVSLCLEAVKIFSSQGCPQLVFGFKGNPPKLLTRRGNCVESHPVIPPHVRVFGRCSGAGCWNPPSLGPTSGFRDSVHFPGSKGGLYDHWKYWGAKLSPAAQGWGKEKSNLKKVVSFSRKNIGILLFQLPSLWLKKKIQQSACY